MAIRALDINRMPTAQVAIAVVEMRRLAGWTAQYLTRASADVDKFGSIEAALVTEIEDWNLNANASILGLRNALIDAGYNPDLWGP